eukprot:3117245-Rhodomonas_salina.1
MDVDDEALRRLLGQGQGRARPLSAGSAGRHGASGWWEEGSGGADSEAAGLDPHPRHLDPQHVYTTPSAAHRPLPAT